PRAFGLAFLVVCALLVAILYGLNRNPNSRGTTEAYASPPPPQPTNMEHFGQNEPIVATALPATPPPPLVLPPTAVPNLDQQEPKAVAQAPAAQAPSAEDAAAAQREAEEDRARADEERKRRELAEAAAKSPILANGSTGVGSSGVKLSFAGNSGDAPAPAYVPAVGTTNGGGNASFASNNGTSINGSRPAAVETHAPQSLAYLDGPSGQFRVQPANVVLPAGGNPKDFLQAQRFAPVSPFEIVASSVIPASLITAIDSELPGLVTAQVREDVYDSKTGRYLLVPRGSRLVGLFNSQVQYGQTRVLVAWQRLIFPDTTSIDLLDMSGTDVQGGAGLAGIVDNHYNKIFGAALLTSILAVGAELASPQQTSIFGTESAGQLISQSVGQQIAQTGTQIVQKDLNIPPTLHIKNGYPFLVMVDRDIVLPGVYHGQ
ncbi:MAG: TrbI/VirB10 family protein, partial [Candidatus Eremiobacteraeota bacterium]|nr:TrbI/VirB10 family protein [Candidatus Eremiobacteraeota bacterium]